MIMNRRNVLFVLGTTVLLGGLLIGSGAFSQVQADRTVSVTTEGDASAALGLAVNNSSHSNVEDTGDRTVELSFEKVNEDATVYYDDVLDVENNGDNSIDITAYSNNSAVEVYAASERSFDFGTSGNTAEISGLSGQTSDSLGIALNTSESTFDGDNPTITIEATSSN